MIELEKRNRYQIKFLLFINDDYLNTKFILLFINMYPIDFHSSRKDIFINTFCTTPINKKKKLLFSFKMMYLPITTNSNIKKKKKWFVKWPIENQKENIRRNFLRKKN